MVCPRCTSMYTKKDGKRVNKDKINQRYKCNSCKSNFSIPIDTEVKEYNLLVEPGQIFSYKSEEIIRVHCLTDIHVGAHEFDLKKFLIVL